MNSALFAITIPSNLGYLALAGLVALESTGVPLPGETALIAAGVLASQGKLRIEVVIVVAALAAIAGDNAGYLIGRRGGRALLLRDGPLKGRREAIVRRGEPFFDRHGAWAVFLGRWITYLRIAAAWLAGINRMHWAAFFAANALGGIAWATSVGLLAYLVGPTAYKIASIFGLAGLVLVAVAIISSFAWRRWRHDGR